MFVRNTILTLLGHPKRLDTARKRIALATLNLPVKIGTWKCICGHTNSIYYLSSHAHPLGILACAREDCGLTWHPSTNPITPHPLSDLLVKVRLPNPHKPNEDDEAPYVLACPKRSGLRFVSENMCGGYGYVCLNEKCGLSWATTMKKEWPWGKSRKVMVVGRRRWKGSCLCGRRVQAHGGFVVYEVVRR